MTTVPVMKNYEILAKDDTTAIVLTAMYEKNDPREPATLSNARFTGQYELRVITQLDDGDRLHTVIIPMDADGLDVLKQRITDLRNRTT